MCIKLFISLFFFNIFHSLEQCNIFYFFNKQFFCFKYLKDLKIIVSMTSWPKRINNIPTVIKSILNQNIEPDLIELNKYY